MQEALVLPDGFRYNNGIASESLPRKRLSRSKGDAGEKAYQGDRHIRSGLPIVYESHFLGQRRPYDGI